MSLLEQLRSEAVKRGLLDPAAELDVNQVYYLVRDMPYRRASDRRAETIISEWRGTCSGKHYLLRELFNQMGYLSQLMACTTTTAVDSSKVPEEQQPLYQAANRRFVDVHNYLILQLPKGGEMRVDATWPISAKNAGFPVNEHFVFGEDQQLAADPLQSWQVPLERDPQEYKEALLRAYFSPAELEFRELVIRELSRQTTVD